MFDITSDTLHRNLESLLHMIMIGPELQRDDYIARQQLSYPKAPNLVCLFSYLLLLRPPSLFFPLFSVGVE